MSKVIDTSDLSVLSQDDLVYLRDRGLLPEDVEVGEGDDVAYADMTAAELKAEIEARNEERDESEHLSVQGKKAELISRLEEDDEAYSGDVE